MQLQHALRRQGAFCVVRANKRTDCDQWYVYWDDAFLILCGDTTNRKKKANPLTSLQTWHNKSLEAFLGKVCSVEQNL